jgi:putative nucleotidyltransferase with HDIG domain
MNGHISPRSTDAPTTLQSALFVDDEPKVLSGLERMLRPLRGEWTMFFANGAQEALDVLAQRHVDVLVTDMRMPGIDGVELMQRVLDRHPNVIRMALSGHAERDAVVRAVSLAHQYLSKPCDGEFIKDKLAQAMRLRSLMKSETLQAIASRVKTLRTVPAIYAQLMGEMQSSNPSIARVADIVASDPAIAAKLLQLINSAFFGLRATVSDPARAVQLLGLETVRSVVLSTKVYSCFSTSTIDPTALWQHSLRTATIARMIAKSMGLDDREINEAFTAGLLHDVGKLILCEAMPHVRLASDGSPAEARDAERAAYGAGHAEVGAYLFGLWGLPYGMIEAIAWHHLPSDSGAFVRSPLTAVHVANALDQELHGSPQGPSRLDDEYLVSLGLSDAVPRWKAHVVEQQRAA